jgi:hypothetical protein
LTTALKPLHPGGLQTRDLLILLALSLVQHIKTGKNVPNYHKMYQMATKWTKLPQKRQNGYKIYQHCPLHYPRKFTQIGIFGLKKYTIWQP